MIIPYRVDVTLSRRPYGNYLVIAGTMAVFMVLHAGLVPIFKPLMLKLSPLLLPIVQSMPLEEWSLPGLFGYIWLHVHLDHIIFNMIFLWVFGNAVCAKFGSLLYGLMYVSCGIAGGMAHLLIDGGAVVGASGAISGVIGAYLVLYPFNSISCLFFLRRFTAAGLWLILAWFVVNVMGTILGRLGAEQTIAYGAHVGGFIAGLVWGIVLLSTKIVVRDDMDQAIIRGLDI